MAIDKGTPTSSRLILGSGVMTVRAEKSTRLPIKFPLTRPSFPRSRWLRVLRGLPERCMAWMNVKKRGKWEIIHELKEHKKVRLCILLEKIIKKILCQIWKRTCGCPGNWLSMKVAIWNCNNWANSLITWAGAPFSSCFFRFWLALIMSANLYVRSSSPRRVGSMTIVGLTCGGGTGITVRISQSGRAYLGLNPSAIQSSSVIFFKISCAFSNKNKFRGIIENNEQNRWFLHEWLFLLLKDVCLFVCLTICFLNAVPLQQWEVFSVLDPLQGVWIPW